MELENSNLKEAHMITHDNCRKNGKAKCKLKRGKNCKWRKNRKSKCNLEGAHLTNEEYMEGTNASWKEAT